MKRNLLKASAAGARAQRGPLVVGALLGLLALAVLLPAFQLAADLDDTVAALRLVSEQRRQPDLIGAALAAVRDRLENEGYVDDPLRELRTGVTDLDGLARALGVEADGLGRFAALPARALQRTAPLRAGLAAFRTAWQDYRSALLPLAEFTGLPYADSDSAGVQLNARGRALAGQVRKALVVARRQGPPLLAAVGGLAAALEAEAQSLSAYLRLLMLAALSGAIALTAGLVYFVLARRRAAAQLADAQRQTADILSTVKDGLFLLDARSRIGASHSASLQRLFKREQFAGLSFEELLRPLLADKTLRTAMRFIEVLWSARTRENLVKSINPLREVEVGFDNGRGVTETRWLEFDFHQVRHDGRLVNLLVSVNDVTARVRLAQELAALRAQTQSQVDALLGVLHVNPRQLASFLADTDAATQIVNALLREPAHDEAALRRKIDGIFRQVHAVKGEAAALGLATVEVRAHEFEDALKALGERVELAGGDFLPLVVRLDELLTHLAAIEALVARLAQLGSAAMPAAAPRRRDPAASNTTDQAVALGTAAPDADDGSPLEATLERLVRRVATERGKLVKLAASGLGDVPDGYRRAVKDIALQAVRNALVHGIETPDVRKRAGKPATGTIRVEFGGAAASGYSLVIEDDGAGLSAQRIRDAAVRCGLMDAEAATRLDPKQLLALLFRPGFTTQAFVDEHAGRGVGMNVVAELVKVLNGRIGVASGEGRYTRLTIGLPATDAASAGAAA